MGHLIRNIGLLGFQLSAKLVNDLITLLFNDLNLDKVKNKISN